MPGKETIEKPQFCYGKKNRQRLVVPVTEPRRPEDYEDEKIHCTMKPECEGCRYAAHGFLCHAKDGLCLKTRYAKQTIATT
ncbi:hypothetical protein LJC61_05160 [Ruminococcaceae bacterium OttesenSCG-928-A16]|nr:hypothetical protein [Ruminococcaceae bacterium OttesenSCG-928-A16]